MSTTVNYGERLAAIQTEIETERRHLATKADIENVKKEIESLKNWIMWRVLLGAAIIQGIIAWVLDFRT